MTVDAPRSPSSTGKVLWHLTMSLDGFVAGPNHSMDWLAGLSVMPGLVEDAVATTGAILEDLPPRVARTSRCTAQTSHVDAPPVA